MKKIVFLFFLVLALWSCNGDNANSDNAADKSENNAPAVLSYNIIKVFPHDTSFYTEGLIWINNSLYESSGNYEKSKLAKVDITNGKTDKEVKLEPKYFGEGISILNDTLYQLTWQEHKVFVYNADNFQKIREMNWPFDGWGMTTDGKQLIISTGTSNLYFVNPQNFKILNTIGVTDNYGPVGDINELEYVNGFIYANIYKTYYIIKINAETGKVIAKLDLTGILDKSGQAYNAGQIDVLNGIAYNPEKNSFFITGKYWPALFELKISQ